MALQGRCSANHAIALTTILVFVLLHVKASQATTFMVGDSSGWTFNINNWASGKKFKAGDKLGNITKLKHPTYTLYLSTNMLISLQVPTLFCVFLFYLYETVFKYNPSFHNVVAIDEDGYNGCSTASPSSKVYSTGNDAVKLLKGHNYFICGVPGHCDMGLKIRVNAS